MQLPEANAQTNPASSNPSTSRSVSSSSVEQVINARGSLDKMLESVMSGGGGETINPDQVSEEAKKAAATISPPPAPKPPEPPPPPVKEAAPEPTEEPIQEEEVVPEQFSAAQNIKRLRKEADTKIKALETELSTHREKLTKYESGEVAPEALQELQNEVSRLKTYEKIHALKTSKEYQEAVIKPIKQSKEAIKAIATDYGVPDDRVEEFVNHALSLGNRKDLNAFLSQHFDELGASDVRNLIDQTKGIFTKQKEMEKEPESALKSLESEHKRLSEVRTAENRAKIASVSKESWNKAFLGVQKEGKAQELIFKEGDEARNQIVQSHLNHAAQEYGKFVKHLAEMGVEKLDENFAEAMAKYILNGTAAAFAIETRNGQAAYLNELERNVERTTSYVRPQVGSGGRTGGTSTSSASRDLNSLAEQNLAIAMNRK